MLSRSRASGLSIAGEFRLEGLDALALGEDALLGFLVGVENGLRQFLADAEAEPPDQFAGVLVLLVDGQAHAQAELGVIFEQRVGPGRAAAFVVGAVGRSGQVAAVDGGAAGGVGDHHAVAEQLGHQLDVRGLAAAGAGAGELEQRLEQLHVLHLVQGENSAVGLGDLEEEIPVGGFAFAQRRLGHHVDGAVLDFALALGRADLHAQGAAGAIFGRHLQGVLAVLHVLPAGGNGLEGGGRAGEVAGRRRPWRGSRRAGRPARTCRTGCRAPRSHTGISRAMLRFSHWAVPVGKVPSMGMALTGRSSPSPAMILAVTFWTNSGAAAGTRRAHDRKWR